MSWCPDEVKVRSKFIHAASVEGMKKAVGGISAFVQVMNKKYTGTFLICIPTTFFCNLG